MCRFIAVISRELFDPAPYIGTLKMMARYGTKATHGDGWGFWGRGDYEIYHRETRPIWESKVPELDKVKILFAHARKRGERGAEVTIENVHPFIHRGAVFMHNGFVDVDYPFTSGNTDSEKFFLNILEKGFENAVKILDSVFVTAANIVMYKDGKIWVMRYVRKEEDYYTIYVDAQPERIVISSEGKGKLIPNYHVALIDPTTLDVEYRPVFQDRSRQ